MLAEAEAKTIVNTVDNVEAKALVNTLVDIPPEAKAEEIVEENNPLCDTLARAQAGTLLGTLGDVKAERSGRNAG